MEFNDTPAIIIVANTLTDLLTDNIPKNFKIESYNYSLIGCTNYFNKHFILKILNSKKYLVIDNLNKNHQCSYINNREHIWIITNIFYQKD